MAVIGIDIGTQSLKAILARGTEVLAEASDSYALLQPEPGWAEQDPRLWETALSRVVPEVLAKAEVESSEIDALAVAAQLDGCVAVSEAGDPLSNCLVWMDRRATAHVPAPSLGNLQRTGLVFDAGHMGAKLAWLQNEGGVRGARFHQPTSYLVERLCGARVFDHALASTTMLYDLRTRDYADELLEAFTVSRKQLPAIASSEARAGVLSKEGARLCGLLQGTPIAVGTGDDFATVLGAGEVEPGPLLVGLGTAEVVGALSPTLCIDTEALVETHGFLDGFFVQNPGWQSGGTLRWLRRILNIDSDAGLDELAAQAPAGSEGVTFLPALSGAMAPRWRAGARGCFYGLTSHHGRAHMARAVLEGCAFAMRDVRDRLRGLGLASGDIVLQGGGAHSAFWAQMRADLCQARVRRQQAGSGSAMGARILAEAVANPDVDVKVLAASRKPESVRHEPNPRLAGDYEEAYRRYRKLFDALEPLF